MLHRGRFLVLTTLLSLMPCLSVRAQQQVENARRPEPRNAVTSARRVEASDLANQNMSRVAAAAPQIQAVLARDAGILVELKTWVAKEATDNGQVVDDSMLTDQAIFDRLDRDIEFRAVATRLVQRYGYLLPGVNPDSEIAKQQELVLKERAHIMAARQDHEQAAAFAAAENERAQERQEPNIQRTSCDPRNQSCNASASPSRGIGGSFQQDITVPDMTLPVMPDQMSPVQFATHGPTFLCRPVRLWRVFGFGPECHAGLGLQPAVLGKWFGSGHEPGDEHGWCRRSHPGRQHGWPRQHAQKRQSGRSE